VDKFLAESSRAVFSYRLLIATTDKLHHVARRTINDQEKHVAFVGLSDLLTSQASWHTNALDMRPSPPPTPAKPREHQREAIRDVVKGSRSRIAVSSSWRAGQGRPWPLSSSRRNLTPNVS
jgi:predicted helicase